ncbi:DUF1449 domain-containing protein [Sessilibacter sp. MAH4]
MFAVLFSDNLAPFYDNILSLPTVFFTFFLLVSVCIWLLTFVGVIGFDSMEVDIPGSESAGTDSSIGQVLGGLLGKLGLSGIPITITITLSSLIGWLISYYVSYFFVSLLPEGIIRTLVSLPLVVVLVLVSLIATATVLRPFQQYFIPSEQKTINKIVGMIASVRTSRVDANYGEAFLDDSGAGLILKVRCFEPNDIAYDDKVVILDYLEEQNAYLVVRESEFRS